MISSYVRQSQHTLRRWVRNPQVQRFAKASAHGLAGFCLSAASLEQGMLPLVLGLVWACRGWRAVLVAAGGILGYGLFWGAGSLQGVIWTGLALVGVLLLGDRRIGRELPLLIPSIGMLMVSATGLGFQLLSADNTSILLYLIRVALGGAAPWLFSKWMEKRDSLSEWFCWGLVCLGLAQIAPVNWLNLGFVAAGAVTVVGAFPCAALTGLALDMAGITPIPMTAVTVLGWLIRFFPRYPRLAACVAPGCMGLLLMRIWGQWDLMVLPGLFLGGIAAGFFMPIRKIAPRRGETGAAQVRLEMAAGVLLQTKQLLMDAPERLPDEDALVLRAVGDACTGCSARDKCRDIRKMTQLRGDLLRKPLLAIEEIPVRCKKGSRMLEELRRAQEHLRSIQADRQRQQEYREAVFQQYDFLSEFLHDLSDDLTRRGGRGSAEYDPVVAVYGNRKNVANGDRCMTFAGVGNRYYVVLCDGMGTGTGAVQEGRITGDFLRQLLSCGFPAEHALRSLNSICALRDRAGAVTVDLAEICLDVGKATIYKWGAAASYLISSAGTEKLGTASAPPGLSVAGGREVTCSFPFRRGQVLLLVSDGLEEDVVWEQCREADPMSIDSLAQSLLDSASREDDATVVTIQLIYAK